MGSWLNVSDRAYLVSVSCYYVVAVVVEHTQNIVQAQGGIRFSSATQQVRVYSFYNVSLPPFFLLPNHIKHRLNTVLRFTGRQRLLMNTKRTHIC